MRADVKAAKQEAEALVKNPAIDLMIASLSDADPDVRKEGLAALKLAGSLEAYADKLIEMLGKDRSQVAALELLKGLKSNKARYYVLAYESSGKAAAAAKIPGALEFARAGLSHANDNIQITSAQVLGLLKDPASVPGLIAKLPRFGDAALALAEIGGSQAADAVLARALAYTKSTVDWGNRSYTETLIESAMKLAPGKFEQLESKRTDNDAAIRWAWAQGMGRAKILQSVAGLAELLNDQEEEVRDESLSSLKLIATAEAKFWANLYEGKINDAKKISGWVLLARQAISHPNPTIRANALKLLSPAATATTSKRSEARGGQAPFFKIKKGASPFRSESGFGQIGYTLAGTKESPVRSESRAVTLNVFRGIFSLSDLRQFGEKFLKGLLQSAMPELYASETRRDIAYTSVLSNAAAVSQPVKIARIYESLPDVMGPEMQVLVDLMAKNHGVQLLLSVRKLDSCAESGFRKDVTEEVRRRRKTAHDGFKGVNLRITASGEDVAAFLEGEQMRGLVYGDQGAQDLERVVSHVRGRKLRNILMVRKDPVQGDPMLMPAEELLAAFERLYAPGELPEDVVSTGSLLAQYVQLQAAAEQLIRKSA